MSLSLAGHVTAALAVLAAGAACAPDSGPPDIALDRSACARCGMLISEPQFAAAYRAGAGAEVFDDIGCLLDALDRAALDTATGASDAGSDPTLASVWFLDRDQRWMPADGVIFVRSAGLSTPMHGHIQAFASRAAAEVAAKDVDGSIIESLAELRASWRARPSGDES